MFIVAPQHRFGIDLYFGQAAVVKLISQPVGGIVVKDDCKCYSQGDTMADHKHGFTLMLRFNLFEGGGHTVGDLGQTLASRCCVLEITGYSIKKVMLFGERTERHIFPIADTHFSQTRMGDYVQALMSAGKVGGALATLQGAGIYGIDGVVFADVPPGFFSLASAAPVERTVGRTVPASLNVGFNLSVSDQQKSGAHGVKFTPISGPPSRRPGHLLH